MPSESSVVSPAVSLILAALLVGGCSSQSNSGGPGVAGTGGIEATGGAPGNTGRGGTSGASASGGVAGASNPGGGSGGSAANPAGGDARSDAADDRPAPADTLPPATDVRVSDGDVMAVGAVTPVERNGRWLFEAAGITFEVDPRVGGRITSFGFVGANLLTGPAVNMANWGSTFWTSPQSVWMWPPPPQIDNQPYAVAASSDRLTLTGAVSPSIGVNVSKTFSMDRSTGAVQLTYKVTNQRPAAVRVAPWEITRVANRGLAFFPTGSMMTLSPGATLPTSNVGGVTWFAYRAAEIRADSKLSADATEGWLAYVDGDVLFVKKFPDVAPAMIAPAEGDVQLYTNMAHSYIELENQGPYTTIAPQGSLTWTVTWYLKRLPAGTAATAGSAALVNLVRSTVR